MRLYPILIYNKRNSLFLGIIAVVNFRYIPSIPGTVYCKLSFSYIPLDFRYSRHLKTFRQSHPQRSMSDSTNPKNEVHKFVYKPTMNGPRAQTVSIVINDITNLLRDKSKFPLLQQEGNSLTSYLKSSYQI